MSAFLSSLEVENATDMDDGKWRLTAPLIYQSDVAWMTFTVPAGTISDFASVPRLPLAYMLFGDRASEASVVHDYLYSTHLVPRSVADAVLREASAVTGVSWFARNAMWLGVRLFGWSHWTQPATAWNPSEARLCASDAPSLASLALRIPSPTSVARH